MRAPIFMLMSTSFKTFDGLHKWLPGGKRQTAADRQSDKYLINSFECYDVAKLDEDKI